MPFSEIRVQDIIFTIRFSTNLKHFESTNKREHIIGLQLSGKALHTFSDRSFTLCKNSIYFFNKDEDYIVDEEGMGVSFSVHFGCFHPQTLSLSTGAKKL